MLHSCDTGPATTWLMFTTGASRLPPAAATVVAVAMVLAACGSGAARSSDSSSAARPPTQAQEQQFQRDSVEFAGCVRDHGVANFPDPTSPREFKSSMGAMSGSPAFQSAATACRHLLPGGGGPSQNPPRSPAQVAAALAFARCLRSHGFPDFPDPTSAGDLTHQMLAAAGINLHQPAVVQAADACVGVAHGYITRTDVARFIAGQ